MNIFEGKPCIRSTGLSTLDDGDNDAEQTEGTPENLDNQDLYKCGWLLRVSEGAASATDTHAHAAEQVRESDR